VLILLQLLFATFYLALLLQLREPSTLKEISLLFAGPQNSKVPKFSWKSSLICLEYSKVEPSRPGTKQGDSNILGLTAIGFESPVKRPVRPRLTQIGKPDKSNIWSGLVSPINLASTQKIRKSVGLVQERVENTNVIEDSKKPDGVRKAIRHRTLPLSLNPSPQASRLLSPPNFNQSGRKSEMRVSPNPSGHESNKNFLAVPNKYDERRSSARQSSLGPFLREDFDNKTPECSTNTSSMKLKLSEDLFSELVEVF